MKQLNQIVQQFSRWILLSLMLSIALPIKAQPIQGDNTLGTQVNPNGTTFVITGGTTARTNLFHSFSSFSVPQGGIAEFRVNPTIANILARVTGGQKSEINGQIQASGTANLFLINPNGILFGADARLKLGGSLIATTANAIQFPNGNEFSLTSSVSPQNPLLQVNPSALLFTQLQPAPIANRSIAQSTERVSNNAVQVTGLSVPVGKSLLLVGGNILMDGGRLNALRGRVDLASIAGQGTIGLTQDGNQQLALSPLSENVARGDVTLHNGAQVNLEEATKKLTIPPIVVKLGSLGGDVAIQARNFSLEKSTIASGTIGENSGGSILISSETITLNKDSKISSQTNSIGNAGNIILQASNGITIEDTELLSSTKSRGQGGDIRITASELTVTNRKIDAGTEGAGNAGSISINVTNGVKLNNLLVSTGGQLTKKGESLGSSGKVEIQAGSLTLDQGSQIFSANAGTNPAGEMNFQIRGDILLTNESRISSEVAKNARGGEIILNAQSLTIKDSVVRSVTSGSGNAGNIQVKVRDQVRVAVDRVNPVTQPQPVGLSASTNSAGQGGTITIAADQIELRGKPGSRSGLFAEATSRGAAGNIILSARQLSVLDGAQISVSSSSPTAPTKDSGGDTQSIAVNTQAIVLNRGNIIAETASGNGGNINLSVQDLLLMRRNSQISTSAKGNGGNITITNAPLIVAIPFENSDIRANAVQGRGGNVSIATRGLFGIEYRPGVLNTDASDITASSQFGISGTVTITTPDVDPSQGLVALPENLVDASNQIAQGCAPKGGQMSSFVATGRGGLPLSPNEPLRTRSTTSEWVSIDPNTPDPPVASSTPSPVSESKIVEAQGWIKNATGQVILVEQPPEPSPVATLSPTACLTP
jgi:filamentous hemagglutinin family protein